MKIMFMGTPDFAVKILEGLAAAEFDVCAAVSQPDKKKGRGKKIQMTPVKECAQRLNIPVYQPETLKDGAFMEILDMHKPDAVVVAAYGRLIPEYIINYPVYGCINVHASLLPEYRGAAPIQRAVMDGRKKTGVTIMKMDKGLDTGDMLYQKETEIGRYETSGELFDRLAVLGKDALIYALRNIAAIKPVPQDNDKATYAAKIDKSESKIDWNNSAEKVSNLICAMLPSPAAFTIYRGETVKITGASVECESGGEGRAGDILGYKKGVGLRIKCGDGVIIIKKLQLPGKKSMPADDFVNGRGVPEGRFEE